MPKRIKEPARDKTARASDALALMKLIAHVEGRSLEPGSKNAMDRKWILDTYLECRRAALGKEPPPVVYLTIHTGAEDPSGSTSADVAASPCEFGGHNT